MLLGPIHSQNTQGSVCVHYRLLHRPPVDSVPSQQCLSCVSSVLDIAVSCTWPFVLCFWEIVSAFCMYRVHVFFIVAQVISTILVMKEERGRPEFFSFFWQLNFLSYMYRIILFIVFSQTF